MLDWGGPQIQSLVSSEDTQTQRERPVTPGQRCLHKPRNAKVCRQPPATRRDFPFIRTSPRGGTEGGDGTPEWLSGRFNRQGELQTRLVLSSPKIKGSPHSPARTLPRSSHTYHPDGLSNTLPAPGCVLEKWL